SRANSFFRPTIVATKTISYTPRTLANPPRGKEGVGRTHFLKLVLKKLPQGFGAGLGGCDKLHTDALPLRIFRDPAADAADLDEGDIQGDRKRDGNGQWGVHRRRFADLEAAPSVRNVAKHGIPPAGTIVGDYGKMGLKTRFSFPPMLPWIKIK